MSVDGWKQLVEGWPWFRGEGSFPSCPTPSSCSRFGWTQTVWNLGYVPLSEDDPWGWPISEYEEMLTLQPGLRDLACHLLASWSRCAAARKGTASRSSSSATTRTGRRSWPNGRHARS